MPPENEQFAQLEQRVASLERARLGQLDQDPDLESQAAIRDTAKKWFAEEMLNSMFTDLKSWYTAFEGTAAEVYKTTKVGSGNGILQVDTGERLQIATPNDSDEAVLVAQKRIFQFPRPSFFSKGKFVTSISVDSAAGSWFEVIIGLSGAGGGGTGGRYGFIADCNVLYGLCADTSNEQRVALDTALSDGVDYRLEAQYTPGKHIVFYVDDVEKGGLSQNMPFADTDNDMFVSVAILKNATTSAARKYGYVNYMGIAHLT